MRQNTIIKYWERHGSATYDLEYSPVRDVRLDLLSAGKTVGCIMAITIDVKTILQQGGADLLSQILAGDRTLTDLRVTERLTGTSPGSPDFDWRWRPALISQAHKSGFKPHVTSVAFIQMIEADRFLRGTGIGHYLIRELAKEIGHEYPLFLLEPCPVDYELNMTKAELIDGRLRLRDHYSAVGFAEVEGGTMAASSQTLADFPLKPAFAVEGEKPKLRIAR